MRSPELPNGSRTALLLQDTAEFPSMSMKRYASSLSQALSNAQGIGWQVQMPEIHEPATLARLAGQKNASRWARFIRYPRSIRKFRRQWRPDVCHVLDHSHANLLAACDPQSSVVTIHDLIPMLAAVGELDFKVGRWVRQTFAKKLQRISRCKRVIAISQSTKRQLLRFSDVQPERVEVVYYGVAEAFAPAPEEAAAGERDTVLRRHGVDPGKRVVLHVCTPNRYKNSPALLHALTRLPQEVVLLRVGAPLFDDEQILADQLGVSSRVINAGKVNGEAALAAYYRASDVLAFPSTFEGFGWPPLEAMASGTPVVLSDVASLPEVGGDAALYAAPHDYDALSKAIERLLSDPAERKSRRSRGIEHARTFTWEQCARRTASVYNAVAETT